MPKYSRNNVTRWHMSGVGNIVFKRNARAKRITISIHPSKGVRVTIPNSMPLATARLFVESKRCWIKNKLLEIENNRQDNHIKSGYKTREHELQLMPSPTKRFKVNIENNLVKLLHPETLNATSVELQDAAGSTIVEVFRLEAHKYLPKRVDELAKRFGFTYNTLRIKNIKSRWGSCSSINNINLSIYLMKLPDDLIDYVILHELTHTIHKNHGPNFWNHLNSLMGNVKTLNTQLKEYKTGV
ncbi:MAG: SprT family zinc-dependent metalloprotease [Bacteroidales bacterium]|nr:SprT family zinc-dependent metalloprotease [Bacteroidales bacterium]MDD4672331.1 SprT family zinc-dependent metalloprotease [Bacteroidales bacterium]